MTSDTHILDRLETIEAEIAELKTQLSPRPTRTVKSLKGILGPVDFSEEDFEEAKRSVQERW